MYGTVLAQKPLHSNWRSRRGKRSALTIPKKRIYPRISRLGAWKRRLSIVSVSAATAYAPVVILLVEDDFFLRYDLANCLREEGYAVIESASGEDAIAQCKSGMAIDMVLTDINLGGPVSGWDVARRFRAQRPDMPVVYMSGQAIDRERCVPGSVFVAKPYQHTSILSACSRLQSK